MNSCPCCSASLLRHVSAQKLYWFCPHCYQEMPNCSSHRFVPPTLEPRRLDITSVSTLAVLDVA